MFDNLIENNFVFIQNYNEQIIYISCEKEQFPHNLVRQKMELSTPLVILMFIPEK